MAGLMQSWFTTQSKPHQQSVPAPSPHSTITGALATPSSAEGFQNTEQAYYKQLLSGTGQLPSDGSLPAGVQQNIDAQASLIK